MSLADPLASPSSSPSLSPTRSRRVSARRGSVTAADPWGTHSDINNHPSRETSSRLTIVRVPTQGDEDGHPRRHRRHGSNASISSTSSSGKEGSRMSFAFTSFSQSQPSPGAPPHGGSSPTSSPRMRPHSPSLTRRYSGSIVNANRLSPEQLLDVARQSCNPRPSLSNASTPVSPAALAPASFTLLPDTILLPFIDRPTEVSQLMTAPPTAKLFALLAQMFPADARAPSGSELVETLLGRDPKQWSYADLDFWMKTVDRDVVNDVLWVLKSRACVMYKSELIWERIKGALGVPPELDIDEEELQIAFESEHEAVPESTVGISDNESERYPPVFDSPNPALEVKLCSPELRHSDGYSIEPVLAMNAAPPPASSSLDPSTAHELSEVREEDENEDDGDESLDLNAEGPEVHGLRITTSPMSPRASNYAISPGGSPSPLPLGSPAIGPLPIPRSAILHDKDIPYDALQERGPGHPLFPSSFAHLSMEPTLRNNMRSHRAHSMWAPPPPRFTSPHAIRGDLHRAASSHGGGGYRPFRPDWAQGYDLARHEFAVASSAGSVGGD
ncbi:uncharacterized protein FIBRA_04663 [Fibroporia radiculosa]|uniref:Uncharacterized protein n=1 Tax=Fibroporia radiculosa TaxID=599839 RepID=J4GPL8_9APHY|nr:uncharacterized protein FIBRA_04663 [Fibroporia radiculosa]CCM02560.1 predicted protein [Fibroporia radiculosa]